MLKVSTVGVFFWTAAAVAGSITGSTLGSGTVVGVGALFLAAFTALVGVILVGASAAFAGATLAFFAGFDFAVADLAGGVDLAGVPVAVDSSR
jgi:hypothetical protein